MYITEKGLPNTTGRTSAKSKGPDTRRHGYNESLTILDRVLISSRSRSRIQWAGFSHGGHGPKCQKMHGHPKSQVFSCGHMDPAHPHISVQVHETQVSGWHSGKEVYRLQIKLQGAYRGIQRRKSTDYRLSCRVHTEAYRERNLQITGEGVKY